MASASGLVAVIGIGSNSTRLLVAAPAHPGTQTAGRFAPVERLERVTRLAAYDRSPDGQNFLPAPAVRDTLAAAGTFAQQAVARGAVLVGVVATEAVRAAANRAELTAPLERGLGIPVTIISGEEEAALGWQSVASIYGEDGEPLGVMDIGGGSTDLAVGPGDAPQPESVRSISLGSRTLSERFALGDAMPPGHLLGVMSNLLMELNPLASALRPKPEVAVVIGGTAEVLAGLHRDRWGRTMAGQDALIERAWLMEAVDRLSVASRSERMLLGVPHDRADVVVSGAAILMALLDAWALKQFHVSHRNILDSFIERVA